MSKHQPSKMSQAEETAELARRTGKLLQDIQDRVGGNQSDENAKVAFPTGFIRTKASIEDQMPPTKNPRHKNCLAKNICYTLMEADVLRWLLVRTTLDLVAKRMVVKEVIRILGDVCDGLMHDSLYGKPGPKRSFKQRTERLSERGVISPALREKLDWLWDQRVKVHLWQLTESEYNDRKYDVKQYQRAHKAYQGLVAALNGDGSDAS